MLREFLCQVSLGQGSEGSKEKGELELFEHAGFMLLIY